ncbi:hypothetical protein TREPR_0563 [Treponema primitia ZAS-2]|uniref:Uncharacterized protein n=2 Tax=Treponema primitia TaxID=88058 RepID=F5YKS8_TREPZ|nr:hypothetical protein TREPR_0563 [Treponema primitia ZAS-2]
MAGDIAFNQDRAISMPEDLDMKLMRLDIKMMHLIGDLFSPGFAFNPFKSDIQRADGDAMNKVQDILKRAIYSGNMEQIQQVEEILELFTGLPKNVRKQMDEKNTVNTLSDRENIASFLVGIKAISKGE